MHDYYYRSIDEEEEVIIQAVDHPKFPLSIRVTEGMESSMVMLPVEEIDCIIAGLQTAKAKILTSRR